MPIHAASQNAASAGAPDKNASEINTQINKDKTKDWSPHTPPVPEPLPYAPNPQSQPVYEPYSKDSALEPAYKPYEGI